MKATVIGVAAAGAVIGLGLPWAVSVIAWLSAPGLLPASPLEGVVLATVLIRAFLFFASGRVRRMEPGKAVILFSGDVLILPACAAGYAVTGDPFFGAFGRAFIASWLSAGLLVYPSVATLGIAGAIRSRTRLSSVIPGSALSLGASTLVLDSVGAGAPPNGLQEVATIALGALRTPIQPVPGASELAALCGGILFATLAVYSVAKSDMRSETLIPRLAVCIAGSSALVLWLFVGPPLSAWAEIGLPTAVIVGAIWVIARVS